MNRLWVRFTLVISGILLSVIILPVLFGTRFVLRLEPTASDVYMADIRDALPTDLQVELHALIQQAVTTVLSRALIASALIGILAGIILSRMLLAPLQDLTTGARAIANRDLAHRVPVRGSDEMRMVAESFNDMAGQLEQGEALRRQLLADVSHELRNPLHVLRGSLQAILDGVYPMDEEEVGRLLGQTDHLTTLVNDLRELSLAEAHQLTIEPEPVDLGILVKDVAAAFRPLAAAEKLDLRVELLGPPPTVFADQGRLRQALQNLLWNALRYTPEGGHILLTVEAKEDTAVVTVRDTGAGIAAEHLPHVFDRFYRSDPARDRESGGAGLGLAIVKATVEAHDGTVQAASDGLGRGSTFTIMLPVAA